MLIFISSPFSHKDKTIENKRVEIVNKVVAEYTALRLNVFSPITFGTTLLKYKEMPTDWEFWKNFCESFLEKCDELWVLKMEGWDESAGVSAEIQFAIENNITVRYIEVNEINNYM